MLGKGNGPRHHQQGVQGRWRLLLSLMVIGGLNSGILSQPTWSQELQSPFSPSPAPLGLEQLANIFNLPRSSFETGVVRLDGRRLFLVAVPVSDTESSDNVESTSLQRRIRSIQDSLRQLALQQIPPDQLTVTATLDSDTNQYIITVNNQYLMTVTFLDAQAQGLSPQAWADQLTQIVADTLIQFQEERQLDAFTRQAFRSVGLLLTLLVFNQILSWGSQLLQMRREKIRAKLTDVTDLPDLEAIANLNSAEIERLSTAKWEERQRQLDLWENRFEWAQRILLTLKLVGWGSCFSLVLGFFPQTRWIQVLILQALQGPVLRLAGIGVGTYVTIRMNSAAVDHLFVALRQGRWWKALHSPNQQRLNKRVTTLAGVVKGATATGISIIGLTIAMAFLGVSVTAIITSFSVIGLGISLAAQDLIRDIINGILILVEDQYAEGDWIMVGDKDGVVENITLRITQLRNMEGNLITLPNSTIKAVENLSNGWSRVNLGIEVPYDTNLDQAIRVIEAVAIQLTYEQAWRPMILDAPQVLGVDGFNQHSVTIRLWIKVQPMTQWIVAREYRRRLRLAFEENRILVPYPQQHLWFHTPLNLDSEPTGSFTPEEVAQLKALVHNTNKDPLNPKDPADKGAADAHPATRG